jgi:glycine/D-amino acid oxidase-like deaminating enzyme
MTSDSLPIIDRAPGFDDLIIAAGHVFGNGAGPTTGKLVADLVCGTKPAIEMAPFRAIRPSLKTVEAGSAW